MSTWQIDRNGCLMCNGSQRALFFLEDYAVHISINGELVKIASELNGSMVLDDSALPSDMLHTTKKHLRKLIRKHHQELKAKQRALSSQVNNVEKRKSL